MHLIAITLRIILIAGKYKDKAIEMPNMVRVRAKK